MPLKILGLNHTTAPVEIREQVVYNGEDVGPALARIVGLDGVDEAIVLSTCNRTEIYVEDGAPGSVALRDWLIEDQGLSAEAVTALFTLEDDAAIRHLFRVACGLDSMVLGEPQILGQLKDAYRVADSAGTVGKNLGRLFQHTFSVAKKVRTDTEIGNSPVSVAYAAVSLANQFFSGFHQHTAVLVGAGATIELVARHLAGKNIGRMFVANRNLARAQDLASHFDGFAVPLSELAGTLPEADILISSTASPDYVVTYDDMKRAIAQRKRRPVFAVDIAVPRDLDPDISELSDVYLYSIDDLDKVIERGQTSRESAVSDANRILEEETSRYLSIRRARQVVPLITAIRDRADAIREEVMEQARRRMAKGSDNEEVLEYVTAALLKKLLHDPTVRLRIAGEDADEQLIEAARILFGLEEPKR